MSVDPILFLILAVVAVASALGMLLSRNAVYAALFLVLNFITVAVFYLLLAAPFIAISQITVYAGAIMVLFLFVIMLLGTEQLSQSTGPRGQFWLAVVLAVMLVGEAAYLLVRRAPAVGDIVQPEAAVNAISSIRDLGSLLFTQYLLPFEVTSILLLVAMVGAIVLARQEKGGGK
jgi:NADH-quinone oxidoreductase subunit J